MNTESPAPQHAARTTCCIVGGGPAGMLLALLLARRGVAVTVLEAHADFSRQFRGNTINPAAMRVLDQLGLLDDLLRLRHAKVQRFVVQTAGSTLCFADFSRLHIRYPFVMMLPQQHVLESLATALERYPHAQLVMNARVQELVSEDGKIHGVRYHGPDGWHEVRADLTVGADGRFSRMRKLAGLAPSATASPLDVLWFNLPRCPEDPDDVGTLFRFVPGGLLVFMDHDEYWQVGYLIAKGDFPRLRAAGLAALRDALSAQVPAFAARFAQLRDWKQLSLLSVESSRVRRWHAAGLLLLGDAAHVTSPIGGVGINLAMQDAVVAANLLAAPLQHGTLRQRHLRAVQARREWQVRVVQFFQAIAHRAVAVAFDSARPFTVSRPFRLWFSTPVARSLPAWLIACGVWPEQVANTTKQRARNRFLPPRFTGKH